MTTDRIKEIQSKTSYPNSVSVQQALLQVWNECEQEQLRIANVSQQRELLIAYRMMIDFDIMHENIEESVDYFLKHKESYL